MPRIPGYYFIKDLCHRWYHFTTDIGSNTLLNRKKKLICFVKHGQWPKDPKYQSVPRFKVDIINSCRTSCHYQVCADNRMSEAQLLDFVRKKTGEGNFKIVRGYHGPSICANNSRMFHVMVERVSKK